MLSIKKILVPTDGSETSLESLKYVSSFAGKFEISVYLLAVISPHHSIYDVYAQHITLAHREAEIAKLVEENIAKTAKKAKEMGLTDIKVITNVGEPYKKIIELAEEEKIDLIVIGTHGHKRLTHFLLGSVTEKVIRTAPCPVLVVRQRIHGMIENKNISTEED